MLTFLFAASPNLLWVLWGWCLAASCQLQFVWYPWPRTDHGSSILCIWDKEVRNPVLISESVSDRSCLKIEIENGNEKVACVDSRGGRNTTLWLYVQAEIDLLALFEKHYWKAVFGEISMHWRAGFCETSLHFSGWRSSIHVHIIWAGILEAKASEKIMVVIAPRNMMPYECRVPMAPLALLDRGAILHFWMGSFGAHTERHSDCRQCTNQQRLAACCLDTVFLRTWRGCDRKCQSWEVSCGQGWGVWTLETILYHFVSFWWANQAANPQDCVLTNNGWNPPTCGLEKHPAGIHFQTLQFQTFIQACLLH